MGSIMIVVATDAPLSDRNLTRLACHDGEATTCELANERVSPFFHAVIDATEEAICNSLFAATTMSGRDGRTGEALPIDRVVTLLRNRTALGGDGPA